MKQAGFYVVSGTEFWIAFENGYVVIVGIGKHHHCDNYGKDLIEITNRTVVSCPNAEVAVCKVIEKGDRTTATIPIAAPQFNGDDIGENFAPKDFLDLLNWAAAQELTTVEK